MGKRMITCLLAAMSCLVVSASEKPNIIFIVADDLGWNDVGFHGSNQIPTPNIDALAYSGVILNNYYVTPICTPSRSALMTGKYPIHTGMQHSVLYGNEPRGLPLSEKLLPQYLEDLGYSNHIVGKWHLGSWKREYTPLYRGFHSHLGYWTGYQDYYDHTLTEGKLWGLDMRRGMEPAWDLHGKYSTDIYTDEAVRIVSEHKSNKPLFLYLAHVAVHSASPFNPLQAPDKIIASFTNITDYYRKRFAGMLTKLDESVGKVVQALQEKNILENSIIIFTTDNGGPAAGFNSNAASNWPLRGVKNTLWEGGLRGAGFIWSPMIKRPKRVSEQMMHITDWLPTLLSAAGGDPNILKGIDGVNLWTPLINNTPSNRTEILHNIDNINGIAALTIGDWKILNGTNYRGQWDSWYGPSGREGELKYDPQLVMSSLAGKAMSSIGQHLRLDQIYGMRAAADVSCKKIYNPTKCYPLEVPCLFNIKTDPCETNNLAQSYPEILTTLENKLNKFQKTYVPPGNKPLDPRGNPVYWDNTWANFGDYSM